MACGQRVTRVDRAGDAEIEDLPGALVKEHVLRLEVAVNDSCGCRCGDPGADLTNEIEHLAGGQGALVAEHLGERLALELLHHQVGDWLLADVDHLDHIGRRQAGRRAQLAEEPQHVIDVAERRLREQLDGDNPSVRVDRGIHLAHRAAADHLAELVAADRLIGEPTAPLAQRSLELLSSLEQQRLAMRGQPHRTLELADGSERRPARDPRRHIGAEQDDLHEALHDPLLAHAEGLDLDDAGIADHFRDDERGEDPLGAGAGRVHREREPLGLAETREVDAEHEDQRRG